MVDVIPFVPRLDLWWLANASRGTLPEEFAGMTTDDIARSRGWAIYRMVPGLGDVAGIDDVLHRSIGLFNFKQSVHRWKLGGGVEVNATDEDGMQIVEYHTPVGVARTIGGVTEAMKKAGSSLGWVEEPMIKEPGDYAIAAYIFENLEVAPAYEQHLEYMAGIGEDGVVAVNGATLAASPVHQIQKELIDATRFFYEYNDNQKLIRRLAESIEVYFEKVLATIADSPAEVVLWGANYDDTLTYPPYFEKEILPWLRRAGEVLGAKGKIVATHTDGENAGLMDLIRDCGCHVAESVTPYPMTKVKIDEYYARWRDKITIMGGIPESVLMEETATEEEFETYLDNLFASVVPGDRIILGTADSTPPDAVFARLDRIAERVEREGRLPLSAGKTVAGDRVARTQAAATAGAEKDAAVDGATATHLAGARSAAEQSAGARSTAGQSAEAQRAGDLTAVQEALVDGDAESLVKQVHALLDEGVGAHEILNDGMITAMESVGRRFQTGDAFVPDVLLSARAMNEALEILEPLLAAGGAEASAKVIIGTVEGDMHDIGKNLVAMMLRGAGFDICDLGVNVACEEFVRRVEKEKPDVVGISALLTTTMPSMGAIIDALGEAGLRDGLKVIVGGAPINQKFADDIGADGYAQDAGVVVELAKSLLGSRLSS